MSSSSSSSQQKQQQQDYSSVVVVPDSVLLDFFTNATKALNECTLTLSDNHPHASMSSIRALLLECQTQCLEQAIETYNHELESIILSSSSPPLTVRTVQTALKELALHHNNNTNNTNPQVQTAMEDMNESARLAFTRLVLLNEYLKEEQQEQQQHENDNVQLSLLETLEPMQRSDILEFCGLCQASVRLSNVMEHLHSGTPLFPSTTTTNNNDNNKTEEEDNNNQNNDNNKIIFPHQRLQKIQRLFLKAIGFDPDHGTAEIKRIFFTNNNNETLNEFSKDTELWQIFTKMGHAMNVALTNASLQNTHNTFFAAASSSSSEIFMGDDGVTRVVAVQYSEKLIDEATGKEITSHNHNDNDIPTSETMATAEAAEEAGNDSNNNNTSSSSASLSSLEQQQQQQQQEQQKRELYMARQTQILQQELLGELLTMRDEERDEKLKHAKELSDQFVQRAMQIPAGPERIAFLTSVDVETQRFMAMYKLWESMLAANNGKAPTMRYVRPTE